MKILLFFLCVFLGSIGIQLYNPIDEDKKKRHYGYVVLSAFFVALSFYIFFNYTIK